MINIPKNAGSPSESIVISGFCCGGRTKKLECGSESDFSSCKVWVLVVLQYQGDWWSDFWQCISFAIMLFHYSNVCKTKIGSGFD